MLRTAIALCTALGCLVVSVDASAHARLVNPVRRRLDDLNGGLKGANLPCGMAKPGTPTNTFTVGQTIMVDIQETINHPGFYELRWAANDADLPLAASILPGMNNIANPAMLQASTKVALTLPMTPCANCTLQLIQVMTEDPANPVNYGSCADINLVAAGADLAGVVPPDLAMDPAADLAAVEEVHDMAAATSTDDASAIAEPADMGKRPPAESAGLPGCSMAWGPSEGLSTSMVALLLVGLASLRRRARPAMRRL